MYAVWYQNASSTKERVVGISSSWDTAHDMAKRLYSIKKKVDGMENISTGIFFLEDSILYTSSKPRRWQITPLLSSDYDRKTR